MKIYILDDNFLHRSLLEQKSLNITTKISFTCEIHPIVHFTNFIKKLPYMIISDNDIFLIDISLNSYFNGIDIANLIRQQNTHCFIIFITSDPNKVLFIVNSQIMPFGYIIKENSELSSIDHKLEEIFTQIQTITEYANSSNFVISFRTGKEIINLKLLNYLETIKGNRRLSLINYQKEEHLVNKSLSQLKEELPDEGFFKEFRSFIINLNNISTINRTTGSIHFKDHEVLELSPRMIDKLIKAFNTI